MMSSNIAPKARVYNRTFPKVFEGCYTAHRFMNPFSWSVCIFVEEMHIGKRKTCKEITFLFEKNPSSADSRRASCQPLAKGWALNTGKLSPGGLPGNSAFK